MATRKNVGNFQQLIIGLTSFDVSSEVSLNYNLSGDRPIFYHEDDLAIEQYTTIELTGECISPSDRLNDKYNISLIGKELHHGDFSLKLKDFHARDQDGIHKYRKYRGEELPVYDRPIGISTLNRRRGERVWDSHIWTHPNLCSDILQTINQIRPIYIVIDEYKERRTSWLRSFSIQTKYPEE